MMGLLTLAAIVSFIGFIFYRASKGRIKANGSGGLGDPGDNGGADWGHGGGHDGGGDGGGD